MFPCRLALSLVLTRVILALGPVVARRVLPLGLGILPTLLSAGLCALSAVLRFRSRGTRLALTLAALRAGLLLSAAALSGITPATTLRAAALRESSA